MVPIPATQKLLIKMIQLIITFVVFAFAANGLGNLYLMLIRRGQLLSFMQKPINFLGNKTGKISILIHKSIGGCETCTIQRFADISFFIVTYLNPLRFHSNPFIHYGIWFVLYCLFGGLVFYATALLQRNAEPPKTTKKLEL